MSVSENTPCAGVAAQERSFEIKPLTLGALALVCFITYANSLYNDFLRDDITIVLQNSMVQDWGQLPALFVSDYWASTSYVSDALYRPLLMVSFLINYSVGGTSPAGYHLVNLALHVFVVFAVYHMGLRLQLSNRAALVAALLFAVHPIHTEAVDPITGRADLLATLGVLLALGWYIDLDRMAGFRWPRALASWAAFVVAVLSKETGVVLLGLLVLYEIYSRKAMRPERGRLAARATLFLGHVGVLVGYMALRWAVLGRFHRVAAEISFPDNPIAASDSGLRVINALLVSGKYLLLFLWPADLSADYSYNAIPLADSVWDTRVLGALGIWLGLGGIAVWSYLRGNGFTFFCVGFVVVTLLPVSNLLVPIGTIMGERLFYMPSVGLSLLVGRAFELVSFGTKTYVERAWMAVVATLLAMTLVALMARTIVRNRDWSSTRNLWQAAAQAVPANAKVYLVLGIQALGRGRVAESVALFERALAIYPDYSKESLGMANMYGAALLKSNRAAEAIPYLESAAVRAPRLPSVHSNLGLAYLAQEAWSEAEAAFRRAIALDINMLEAQKGLMLSLRHQGRYLEAIAAADDALARKPDFVGARAHKAAALHALGRTSEAKEEAIIIHRMQGHNEEKGNQSDGR